MSTPSASMTSRWWFYPALIAVSLVLGVLSLFLVSPTYRASASVEIEDQPTKVLGTEDFQQVDDRDPDRLLQTQIDISKSRALAERVSNSSCEIARCCSSFTARSRSDLGMN